MSDGNEFYFEVKTAKGDPGEPGADGVGVQSATINGSGHLILTLTDGTVVDCGNAKGAKGDKGDKGDTGATGADGEDGISVTGASINTSGHLIITLSNGTTVDAGDAKGDKGDTGATGAAGADGEDGADGVGIVSIIKTGTSGKVDTYTITLSDGTTKTFTVTNGTDGANGTNGADGQNGITPTIGNNGNWYLGTTDTGKPSRGEQGIQGVPGQNGAPGADGHTPVKGTDYWTAADKQGIVNDVLDALPTWTGGSY